MDPETLLDELIAAAVIEPEQPGRGVRLHPALGEAVDAWRGRIETERSTALEDLELDGLPVHLLDESIGREFFAQFVAVHEAAETLSMREVAGAVVLVDQLVRGSPAAGGAPSTFQPVRGDILVPLAYFYRVAIAYVWERESSHCALMSAEFDAIFGSPPDDLALFATSLEEWRHVLGEAYDVKFAPTTLFLVDGVPDARLVGPQYRGPIENEIRHLRHRL